MKKAALTLKGNGGLLRVLMSQVVITTPFVGGGESGIKSVKVNGIWDTGATSSVINKEVAVKIGLNQFQRLKYTQRAKQFRPMYIW